MSDSVPVTVSIPPDLMPALREHIAAGNPILAIRDLRRVLGCDLATSKRLIEAEFGLTGTRLELQADGSAVVSGPGATVPTIHGVALDNPRLSNAVMHASEGNDEAAVNYIAQRFGLSAVEAEQVFHALVGDGPRPAGCFLDEQGRLKLMAPGTDILDEIQEVTPSLLGATLTMPSRTCPGGVRWVGLDEIDGVFHALDEERRQTGEDLESYEDTLSWMRAEIGRLDAFESAFLAVNELAPPSDWLRDLKAALSDTDALYALRGRAEQGRATQDQASGKQAALPFTALTESFRALADTFANPAGSQRGGVTGYEVEVRIPPGGFTVPDAPAQPKVEHFDEPQPGWLPEGWTYRLGAYNGPDGCKVFMGGSGMVCAWGPRRDEPDYAASEREKKLLVLALAHPERVLNAPTFAGLAQLKADGFLQELNRLVLHPAGRALGVTLDDSGRVLDAWVDRTDDPAGWGFVPAEDDADFQANAANVAREIEAHRRARLADPDLGSVVECVPGEGPRWESVARDPDEYDLLNTVISNLGLYETYEAKLLTLLGKSADPEADAAIRVIRAAMAGATEDHAALRTRAESFLLSDDATDLTSYDLGAHEAALAILRGDGSGPDPRVTMRGEIEQGRVAVAGLMELLGQRVVADGERSIAQLSTCAYLSQAIEGNPAALNFLEDGWTWLDDKGEPRSYVATVQRIEGQTPGQMIAELKAQNARLKAILDAETGRKGLPGWTWGGWVDRVWRHQWPLVSAAVHPVVDDLNPAKAFVYLGALGIEIQGVTDALDGMEKATSWARARGYTAESPDLDPTTADKLHALWDAGDDIGAVSRYRHLFTPPMDVSDALRAVRKVVDAPVETTEGRKSFFSRYEALIQAERDAVDARLLALSSEEIPE